MAEYVYPAVFHSNSDGTFTITYPDLPGCITEGKSLENAMYMAQSALTQWLEYAADQKHPVPPASRLQDLQPDTDEFINLIRADVKDNRAVKRTVSIPCAARRSEGAPARALSPLPRAVKVRGIVLPASACAHFTPMRHQISNSTSD